MGRTGLRRADTIQTVLNVCGSLLQIMGALLLLPLIFVFISMQIAEITRLKGFPEGVLFTCVFHDLDKNFEVPTGSTVVAKQDRLFLCGKRQNILKVAKLISK